MSGSRYWVAIRREGLFDRYEVLALPEVGDQVQVVASCYTEMEARAKAEKLRVDNSEKIDYSDSRWRGDGSQL